MHWTNAVAMIIMIGSGWAIYNDEVIFGWLHFPGWMTLGAGPEGALQWHFLAMWILALNGIVYLSYGLATGRFRRMLLPIRIGEVIAEVRAAAALTAPSRTAAAMTNGKMANSSGWICATGTTHRPKTSSVTTIVNATITAMSRTRQRRMRCGGRTIVMIAGATTSAPSASPSIQSADSCAKCDHG